MRTPAPVGIVDERPHPSHKEAFRDIYHTLDPAKHTSKAQPPPENGHSSTTQPRNEENRLPSAPSSHSGNRLSDVSEYYSLLNSERLPSSELLHQEASQSINAGPSTDCVVRPVFLNTADKHGRKVSLGEDGDIALPLQLSLDLPPMNLFPEGLEPGESGNGAESFAKQLRRLQKRTDTILLKRTQWRQEYEKLESCRRFLRESTKELMDALQIQRPEDATSNSPKTKKRRKRKTMIAGEGFDAGQTRERQVHPLARAHSESGTAIASQGASESVESDGTATSREKIYNIFQRYLDDMEALSRQESIERTLMEDLSNSEFHVTKMIEDIQKNMRSPNFAEDLRTELLEGSFLSQDSSFTTNSEEELHPLIAEYFDLHGTIGIYLERLQDLDYEHQEGLQEREFVRDRGDPLEPPDEQFYSNYNAQRNQTEQALNKARGQLEIVDARCKQAGLDPEMHRDAARSQRSVSPIPSIGLGTTRFMSVKPTNEATPHPPLDLNTGGQSSLRIEGWLRRIPDESLVAESVPPPLVPQYEQKKPSEGSLASFEFRSFDLGVFGLPKHLDVDE